MEATIEFFAEGEYYPTAQQIADRAGVSLRSLFRYTDTTDTLAGTALAQWGARLGDLHLAGPGPEASLIERARRLAVHQSGFWLATSAYRRALAVRRVGDPEIAGRVDEWHDTTRRNVIKYLEHELAACPHQDHARHLGAAMVVMDAATTDHLAGMLGYDQPDLAIIVAMLIEGAVRPCSTARSMVPASV